jgi:peptide/nickel transport system substrate-binding protein
MWGGGRPTLGRITRRALLATTAAALARGTPAAAQGREAIAVRIDRDAEVLDPAFRSGLQDGNIIRAVFQKLIGYRPGTTDLENDAAAELRQVSDTVLEFRLKPGQLFTDGFGEMTAEDVKFSFERFAVAPVGGRESPYKGDWANLKGVEVTGPLSGRIVLERPRASLFNIALADVSGSIVSKKAVEARGLEHAIRPVGSGPMMVASFEKQRHVILRRNPDYRGPASGFAEVAVRYVQDPKTAELALRAGELDFAGLPPAIADSLRSASGVSVAQQPGLANVWLGMNVERGPLADPRVRQAIRLALDVDQMLLAGYGGKAPRANALVMPQVLGHWSDAPVYRRDVAAARRLLAEAGHARGFRTRITVLNQPVFQSMALVARAFLAEVGIDATVDAQDGGSFWSAGKGETGRGLELFILRFNGKLDPNFLAQWFTADQIGLWNWQRWANPEFDALLDKASAELDPVRRIGQIIQAQKLMDESAAFVWLTYDVSFYGARSWLRPAYLPGGIDWQLSRFTQVAA